MKPATKNKIVWTVIIVALIVLMYGSYQCGISSVVKQTHIDTAVTIYITDTAYEPSPAVVITDKDTVTITKYKTDTLETIVTREVIKPTDTAAILARFNEKVFYRDSQNLTRGYVIVSDSLYQNRITKRRLQSFGTDTTIKVKEIIVPPKRIIGFFTFSAMGNRHDPLAGAGMGFSVKMPNDLIIGVEGKTILNNRPMGEFKISLPIKFGRRTR